jgi:hypothetical protein
MNTVDRHPPPTRPPRRWWVLWAVLGLAIVIVVLHGRAVTYGLFMDDYAHYQQLRDCGWSVGELTRACQLELIGGVIELWWMPECTLRFFRPVAFGLMKLTYTLSGWSPVAMHIASLGWHLAACALLMLLLRRLGTSRLLAWAVAALFAIHPGHVATVQWIASQTELIVTTLLLAALLCFAEFRRWPSNRAVVAPDHPPPPRWRWGVLCAVFFALVVLAIDLLICRRPSRPALALFAVLGIAIGVYAGLRSHYLGGTALPPRPYVVPPTDPGFFRFVLDKACYYLLGEFLLVPCVPIGGLAYLRDQPLAFYGLALLLVAVLTVLVARNRRRSAAAVGPACLFGFMVPVLPAFESPHHLYLPGVGWAILAALLFEEIGGAGARIKNRIANWRRGAMWLSVTCTGLVFAVTTHFFGLAFDTAQAVEDQVAEEIASAPRPVNDGDTLYVANLPVIAHYVKLAVEERTGKRDLRVIALTWSPRLLGMATPSELTLIDGRTIELRVAQDHYFSGPLRLLIREALGGPMPGAAQQPVQHKNFTVEWLDGDDKGVSALRFTFEHDLAQTGVHLFWGSQERWAYQVCP